MLKELLKNKKFLKIIKEALKKPEILDIILFGSYVKGKEKPNDIDLLILYSPKTKDIIEINYKIRKELEKVSKNIEVIGKFYSELFSSEFLARESILSEGFSLSNQKFLSECFGYKNLILFKYYLKEMNKSERMRFYYSLYGRGNEKGLLEKNQSYKFSETVILAPLENSEVIKDFLEKWKIEYIEFPILIPDNISNNKIKNGIITKNKRTNK